VTEIRTVNAALDYANLRVGPLCRTGKDWHYWYEFSSVEGKRRNTWSTPRPYAQAVGGRREMLAYFGAKAFLLDQEGGVDNERLRGDADELAAVHGGEGSIRDILKSIRSELTRD
jgi:hypothetical protein